MSIYLGINGCNGTTDKGRSSQPQHVWHKLVKSKDERKEEENNIFTDKVLNNLRPMPTAKEKYVLK